MVRFLGGNQNLWNINSHTQPDVSKKFRESKEEIPPRNPKYLKLIKLRGNKKTITQ